MSDQNDNVDEWILGSELLNNRKKIILHYSQNKENDSELVEDGEELLEQLESQADKLDQLSSG